MAEVKLKDPAENVSGKKEEQQTQDDISLVDASTLSFEDFQAAPATVARTPHPFEGYPYKKVRIKEGEREEQYQAEELTEVEEAVLDEENNPVLYKAGPKTGHPKTRIVQKSKTVTKTRIVPIFGEVNATFIIALNPKEIVPQDPSGKGISIITGQGKAKRETRVDIRSSHSRITVDYEEGGVNRSWVFDREYPLKDGQVFPNCSFVPSHSSRAQIMFKLDKREGRIMLDRRYVLPDPKQLNRLRRIFEMIVNPQLRAERLAKGITGESDEALDDMPEE